MSEADSAEKLKVFISYSRRDSTDFADELVAGLEVAGFAPFLDRHDIAAGEKWEERLGGLIEQADTVVFVISPGSVKSERCAWEVERTLQKSKRLLPVVFKAVPEADMPEQLRERQFVRFDGAAGFARPLAELAQALRRDLEWIREHTRLGELAARWETRGRPQSLLLRGEDVGAAQAWADQRKSNAPSITDATRAFIAASKEADAAFRLKAGATEQRVVRFRRLVAIVTVTSVGVLIVVLAAWWRQDWLNTRFYVLKNVNVLTVAQEKALKPGDPIRECKDCPRMIVVPRGSFMMGSPPTEKGHEPDEAPMHIVKLANDFAVSVFEITFQEWDICVKLSGCKHRANDRGWGRGQRPVIDVNWFDVQEYAAWISQLTGKPYHLLSEAEWEYIARAQNALKVDNDRYSFGNEVSLLEQYAWFDANAEGKTQDVGTKLPNKFGLYDTSGNVSEWVQDCYLGDYSKAPEDGSPRTVAECNIRVVRGGSWTDDSLFLRSASRIAVAASSAKDFYGFRIARTLAP
jgi:formylglycine-generating enzyme required for sulfatase activity